MLPLSLAGLAVVVALVAWFVHGVWRLRDLGSAIYVLHDVHRTDADRIQAAYRLSRDPRLPAEQAWEMCLRKPLPNLSRYLLAESLRESIVAVDPKAYAEAVAYSPGWPDWLRVLLVRPMAYAAANHINVPRPPIDDLLERSDPAIVLWAQYIAAANWQDRDAIQALRHEATGESPRRELAAILCAALDAPPSERPMQLDQSTIWLRRHHPQAARIWENWDERGGRLVPQAAPELPPSSL